MEIIYLYCAFSVLFMFGSAVEDSSTENKQSAFIYFIGILFAPLIFPLALGVALTKGDKDE